MEWQTGTKVLSLVFLYVDRSVSLMLGLDRLISRIYKQLGFVKLTN